MSDTAPAPLPQAIGSGSSPAVRTQRRNVALDELGEQLDVLIRISADGRVFFHDIPLGMLPVAACLAPTDPEIAHRAHAALTYRRPPQ